MSHNYTNKSYCGLVSNANELNNSIKRFWEIENCPDFEIPTMNREEKFCEEHFTNTYNRDETSRFIVKMPLCQRIRVAWEIQNKLHCVGLIRCGED
ncbi:hypothetical protein TNCV_75921 [Trichonephila clavipes]|nr:hypothetical protein TNCV_75921 [Trichonephila clavipes]